MRRTSPIDTFIQHMDSALRTVSGTIAAPDRPSPATTQSEPVLSETERREAARLMRVNHCGEVCAQALYHGQALTARHHTAVGTLDKAAKEEADHLAWCQQRIRELDSHTSYLNPLWYAASFSMGAVTGLLGDKINLGFVAATEEEVVKHIDDHLARLPEHDTKSRSILDQMRKDEQGHQHTALEAGGAHFPPPVKSLMKGISRLMTRSTYWL